MLSDCSADTVTRIAAFLTIPELARLMHSRKELLDLLKPGFQTLVDTLTDEMQKHARKAGNQLLSLFNKPKMFQVYMNISAAGVVDGYAYTTYKSAFASVTNESMVFRVRRSLDHPYMEITFEVDKTTQVRVRVMPSSFTAGVIVLPGGAQREYQGDVARALTREYPTLGTKF